MSFTWVQRLIAGWNGVQNNKRSARRQRRAHLQLAELEGRLCPSSWIDDISTSTTTTISGPGDPGAAGPFIKGSTVLFNVSFVATNIAESSQSPAPTLTISSSDGSLAMQSIKIGTTETVGCTIRTTGATFSVVSTGFNGDETAAVAVSTNQEQLRFLAQPAQGAPGSPIIAANSKPVTVEVLNASGTLDTAFNGSVIVAMGTDVSAGGNAVLSGTLTQNAVGGIATFSNLSIDKPSQSGLDYTLKASLGDGDQTISTPFANDQKLVFATEPVGTGVDLNVGYNPVLVYVDYPDGATVDPSYTGAVNLQLAHDPTGQSELTNGTATGVVTTNASSGVADFNDFGVVNNQTLAGVGGQGFTVQASIAEGASAVSTPFNLGDSLKFVQQPSSAVPGQSPLSVMTVEVLTPQGQPDSTSGDTVTLSIAHDGSGKGATLGGTTTVPINTTTGIATFTNVTLANQGGGYTLQAALNSGGQNAVASVVSSSFTIGHELSFSTQPSNTPVSSVMTPVVVSVLRPGTNAVDATYNGPVTLAINPAADPSNGAASLSGSASVTVNAVNGSAVFTSLDINSQGNGFGLLATLADGAQQASATFDVTQATATSTDHLVFKNAPTSTVLGQAIKTPVVTVNLPSGAVDTTFTGVVSLTLSGGSGANAHLLGAMDVKAIAGTASFPGLIIDQIGSGYTLEASISSTNAISSQPFNITAPATHTPTVVTAPASQSAFIGGSATFSVEAVGSVTPIAEWEESTDGFRTVTVLTSGVATTSSGNATVSTLTLSSVAASENGEQFRAVFTNGTAHIPSAAATLTVLEFPQATQNPVSAFVAVGRTISFTAVGTGSPAPSVQWMESTDGGQTFAAISDTNIIVSNRVTGATTTSTLSIRAATAKENGQEFEPVFTNALGSVTGSPATLADVTPTVTLQPVAVSVPTNGVAVYTAAATGDPAITTANWQVHLPRGKSFTGVTPEVVNTLIAGGIRSTLYLPGVPAALDGTSYFVIFSSTINGKTVSSVTTKAAPLGVGLPTVTTNPKAAQTTAGTYVEFTAAGTATLTPRVQWQVSSNGGVSYTNIFGADSTTLRFRATAADSGYLYRAVFYNAVGSAASTAAMLTVAAPPTVLDQPISQTVHAGDAVSLTALAAGSPDPNTTVQWYESNNGSVFNAVTGATSDVLTVSTQAGDSGNSEQFYAVFTNSVGIVQTEIADVTIA
jgi:hypothetical protein